MENLICLILVYGTFRSSRFKFRNDFRLVVAWLFLLNVRLSNAESILSVHHWSAHRRELLFWVISSGFTVAQCCFHLGEWKVVCLIRYHNIAIYNELTQMTQNLQLTVQVRITKNVWDSPRCVTRYVSNTVTAEWNLNLLVIFLLTRSTSYVNSTLHFSILRPFIPFEVQFHTKR